MLISLKIDYAPNFILTQIHIMISILFFKIIILKIIQKSNFYWLKV